MARVVSGGQSGVDRAALDAALAIGLRCGGWCPAGREAEDGPIPAGYPLRETPTRDPADRTLRNVRDSDGTLILVHAGVIDRGTALTRAMARALGRPLLVLDLAVAPPADALARWLPRPRMTLNVAGPRESRSPGIYALARQWLERALTRARCRHTAAASSAAASSGTVGG